MRRIDESIESLTPVASDSTAPLAFRWRGRRYVVGAVFASGILAKGPVPGARYAYADASPEIMEKTRRIAAVCERHGVPLAAAAR